METTFESQVEAVLFASGRFFDASQIAELLDCYQEDIQEAVAQLNQAYQRQKSALQIIEEQGAYKLHVRDEYLELVSSVVSDTELSGPVLETLAVIAWRSPVLQSDVIDIRGSNAYDHIKEILEREFITREPEGRSYRIRITDKFFEYFDIEGREDIREVFKAVEEEHRKKEMELELEQKRLQQAIEAGEAEQEDQEPEIPADKTANIDDLDDVLERSAKRREEMSQSLKEASKKDDDDGEPEQETAADEDEELEEAKRVRKQVEADADSISKNS